MTGKTDSPIMAAVNSLKRWTIALYILLSLAAVGTFTIRSYDLQKVDHQAETTTKALCALRADLKDRVENSRQFLEEHPNGIPGIPAATFKTSIEGQLRTIEVLKIINCEEAGV